MKAQSVLYNYTILNLDIYTIQFFKVESLPFTIYFGKSPHMECPLPGPIKTKKAPPLSKIFLRNFFDFFIPA